MGVTKDFIFVWFADKWDCAKWREATSVNAPLWHENPDPRFQFTDKQCDTVRQLVDEVSLFVSFLWKI